ncbi:hypothetical protein QEV83_13755 [Methylocapsa sp. D3K7]|uniref:hypothetical protein n=1 Tax=Methylocapsa sp. D3K7 TaxID=3041435 RepID=UPI00244E6398|nr:hypothetical protein [Methylocapsa sp. D3K7]WGJ13742.1 hypothetical protein QEV83_13755 [Methylocapsa sp. D3K7]
MAKKAKVIDYPGELGRPVSIQIGDHPPRASSSAYRDPAQSRFDDYVKEVCRNKLLLLLSHYNIDLEDPKCWEKLALDLASAHVPGFQLEFAGSPGGRPITWSDERRGWLAIIVDSVKAQHPNRKTDAKACAFLSQAKGNSIEWAPPENHKGSDRSWTKTLTNRLSEGRKTDFYKAATRVKGMSLKDMFLSSQEKPTSLGELLDSLPRSSSDKSKK